MTTKKKKSAKQRRVLIVALIVAVAIVAASTFAWFSSKDEVTNRLTALANYNVSIVEDFQPPADWLPGQTINKDVAAVNTGNVDAFVRMWLDGKLRLLNETAVANEPSVTDATVVPSGLAAVTDADKIKLGLNFYSQSGNAITYYKTLSTDQIDNPKDINHTSGEDEVNNEPAALSEVQSMQAAGVLVCAPDDAKYTWTLEQAADLWVYDANDTNTPTLQRIAKGVTVGSVGSGATYEVVSGQSSTTGGNYYGAIDASTFKPETTGLYLFRRNIGDTADGSANTFEYSGYYFVASSDVTAPQVIQGGGKDVYFALHTDNAANKHSDYVVPADAVTENNTAVPTANQVLPIAPTANLKLFTASETLVTNLTWTYSAASSDDPAKFNVTNNAGISIDIALANIGTDSEKWTPIFKDNNKSKETTFYYNNDLEAGDTTRKLVDKVTLSGDTVLGSYLAFDFDLDVFLDSIQVTMDEEENESAVTVKDNWATTGLNNDTQYSHDIQAAKASSIAMDGGEIDTITWQRV